MRQTTWFSWAALQHVAYYMICSKTPITYNVMSPWNGDTIRSSTDLRLPLVLSYLLKDETFNHTSCLVHRVLHSTSNPTPKLASPH